MDFKSLKSKLFSAAGGVDLHCLTTKIGRLHGKPALLIPNAMNRWQMRFRNTSNYVRTASRLHFRTLSSVAWNHGLRYVKKSCNSVFLRGLGGRFYGTSVGGPNQIQIYVDPGRLVAKYSSSFSGWFRNHKFLGFTIIFTITFGCLQWIPVSNRLHMAISTDKIENLIGSLHWEQKARDEKRRLLSPRSPESIQVARVLREILQATNQVLGLKNDFQVSIYVPRKELQMPKAPTDSDPILSRIGYYLKFKTKVIRYYLSHPIKRVQNKPRKVRKFGIQYGTKHFDGLNWEVMMVEDWRENAAYLPNGRILFYTGWFKGRKKQCSHADLATILAHEVGHGLARHNSENLLRILWIISLIIIPIGSLGVEYSTHTGAIVGAITAFISRRRELEADRIGMMLMAAAGYNPRHAPKFFEKHGNIEHNFLESTHPTGEQRGKKLRKVRAMRKAEEIYNQVKAGHQVKTFI